MGYPGEERRYDAMKIFGARDITIFNRKLASLGSNRPEEYGNLEHMPYLLKVIDELAYLIMTAALEAQNNIVRLALVARAAVIHMILTTQRPSVEVVTSIMKASL